MYIHIIMILQQTALNYEMYTCTVPCHSIHTNIHIQTHIHMCTHIIIFQGLVYFDSTVLTWRALAKSWLKSRKQNEANVSINTCTCISSDNILQNNTYYL